MRILVVSNLLPPRVLGGYEIAGWKLAKGLRDRGHEILVLTSPAERAADDDQECVDRGLSLKAYAPVSSEERHIKALVDHEGMVSQVDNTLIVLAALRRFRPDHVLLFNPIGLGALAILGLLNSLDVPWTLNLGDRIPNAITEGVAPEIASLFGFAAGAGFLRGRYAPVSQSLADEIAAGGVELGTAVRVIPRGVIVPSGVSRERPYRAEGRVRFVSAGTLSEGKGVGLIVEAAARLKALGHADFSIEVYGDGERSRFEDQAAASGVAEFVSFKGAIAHEELFEVLSSSDAFLFPTLAREPFGSAPIEAAAVGCVPILTAGSGAAERLVDGVHCIKIERSAAALAAAMLEVIAGEADLAALGAAGQAIARSELSFERSVERLEEFLAEAPPPDWRAVSIGDPGIGAGVVARDSAASRLLYDSLAREDAALAERSGLGSANRLVARLKLARAVLFAGARRLDPRVRARRREAGIAVAPAAGERLAALEAENDALRKDNLALRAVLASTESDANESA